MNNELYRCMYNWTLLKTYLLLIFFPSALCLGGDESKLQTWIRHEGVCSCKTEEDTAAGKWNIGVRPKTSSIWRKLCYELLLHIVFVLVLIMKEGVWVVSSRHIFIWQWHNTQILLHALQTPKKPSLLLMLKTLSCKHLRLILGKISKKTLGL